jgi:hypothetical protein
MWRRDSKARRLGWSSLLGILLCLATVSGGLVTAASGAALVASSAALPDVASALPDVAALPAEPPSTPPAAPPAASSPAAPLPAAPLPAAPLPAEECYPGIPGGLVCPPGHFLGFGNKGGCRTTTCETGQYTALRGITTFNRCAERCLRDASCKAFEWFPRPRGLLPSRAPCEIHRDVPVRKQRPTAGRPVRPLTTVAARGLES